MNKSYRQLPSQLWAFDEFVDWFIYICKTTKMPTTEIIPHYFSIFGLKDSAIFTAVVDNILLDAGFKINPNWMWRKY